MPFYDLRRMAPPRQVRNGFGAEERFPRRAFDKKPGPGEHVLPPTVGGCHPSLASKPLPGFGKGEQCDQKFFLRFRRRRPAPLEAL